MSKTIRLAWLAALIAGGSVLGADDSKGSVPAWRQEFAKARKALAGMDYDRAVERSVLALKQLGTDPSMDVARAEILTVHGLALLKKGQYKAARKSVERAVGILDARRAGSYELSVGVHVLAELELYAGNFKHAEVLARENLARARTWPPYDAETIGIFEGVSAVVLKLGKYRSAKKLAALCLAIRRAAVVRDPIVELLPLAIVAAAEFYQGDYRSAESRLRIGIASCTESFGPLNARTVEFQGNLLRTLTRGGELGDAAKVAKSLAAILQRADQRMLLRDRARTEFVLGEFRSAQGDQKEALKLVRAAEERLKKARLSNHTDFADCRLLSGLIQKSQPRVALPALEDAASIYSRALGDSHPKAVRARLWILRVRGDRSKSTLAQASKLLAELEAKIGPEHPDVLGFSAWLKATDAAK